MTDILTRMRAMTPANLAGVRTDFDDLVPSLPVARPAKSMVRIVEGADDLVHPNAGQGGNGGVVPQDWSVLDSFASDRETRCLECGRNHGGASCAPRDARSEGQVRYMDMLISWIAEKDAEAGMAARTWTDNVTAAAKWTYDKSSKFSISGWIDKLKAKNEALKLAPKPEVVTVGTDTSGNVQHDEMPQRMTKTGKPMPQYFAVEMDGTLKFYKIKAGTKPGWWWIDVQASDEFHPIRNVGTKNSILRAIIAAGAKACMERYGNEIGSCGRCHRTLTDADSRTRGIGPECKDKM